THLLKLREIGAHAIFEHETVVAPIIRFTNGGVDADLGGHSGHQELFNAAVLENGVQIGGERRAFARFINDWFVRQRREIRNDVASGLPADQDSTHRADIANTSFAAAADLLGRRQVGQIRTMTFSRVYDLKPGGAAGRQQLAVRPDRATQLRNVIAQYLA